MALLELGFEWETPSIILQGVFLLPADDQHNHKIRP
jgi:hypothetical protein